MGEPETNDDERRARKRDATGESGATGESEWQRKRRIAEIFGDVEPSVTTDEVAEPTPPTERGESAGDRWLKDQVPPHHGGQ